MLQGYCNEAQGKQISDHSNGRLRCIIFRTRGDIIHSLRWSVLKLLSVTRRSGAAEIVVAAKPTEFLLYLQFVVTNIYYSHPSSFVPDFKVSFKLLILLKEPTGFLDNVFLAAT